MDAAITARTATSFTLQVEVRYNDSMLGFEEALQRGLNEAGVLATAEGLKRFDTDGSPITVGPVKFTSKGQVEKDYQTPYPPPASPATSTSAPGADRPTARSTGTPGSWSALLPVSPRSSPTSMPSLVPPGSRSTWRKTTAATSPAA